MTQDDQIFTKEQLLKVKELAESLPSELVATSFGMKPGRFVKLKREQPELQEAYNEGAKIRTLRRIADKAAGRKKVKLIKMPERNISVESECSLSDFKKQFEENRKREIRKKLKDLDLI